MASTPPKLFFLSVIVLLACGRSCPAEARLSGTRPSTLAARLKMLDGESSSVNCWDTLFQLQSCSGEIIIFFISGETHLGEACCEAIRTIGQHCWPNMIGTLGFTTEEGDILEGYCQAALHASPPPVPDSKADMN